jgi:hypothetical protein
MSAVPQPEGEIPEIPPGIRRSMEAYWRDLPQLLPLKSRKRRWVAYHGEERVAFGRGQWELYDECFRRGLREEEFFVGPLEQDYQPPWEPEEVEDRGEWPDDENDSGTLVEESA